MIILLNGPLGIGKSTLAEALSESIDRCVMLDGDHINALNPPPADESGYLHTTLALLFSHHRQFGYEHFVIDHLWTSQEELRDLAAKLREVDPDVDVRRFLLFVPLEENLRRIQIRQQARALDEREFENRTVFAERNILYRRDNAGLGELFDVTASPVELVA
ncbi:MAG: Gar/GrdA family gentamicin resistance ATP-binding protein, partial [Pyrinomonadaceae bacterium]|nr:Gar/GrdA family gentamicin resistance ATP-binding protein [Pyrinomonadaceae bacterium]